MPVVPPDTCLELDRESDGTGRWRLRSRSWPTGRWYEEFSPPADEEIRKQLCRKAAEVAEVGR
ncbi:MAG: hypothetical protein M3072_02410 [Candidatus Dormibacteraeota bacterium]|nr:hypothetical protein [Candidatus Dormibacteraeota bacterium]